MQKLGQKHEFPIILKRNSISEMIEKFYGEIKEQFELQFKFL